MRMIAAAVAVAAGLLAASGAPARAVTIGPGTGGTMAGQAGCEVVLISPLFAPPASCTLFDGSTSQTPRGEWRVRSVSLRTGPRTGPVRFTMIQALRSQAGTQGVICCTASAQSRVFTPAPNRVTRVPVDMKAVNTVELIDGERVEVVNYLGVSLLNRNSAIGFRGSQAPSTTYFIPAFKLGATQLPGSVAHSVTPMIKADLAACAKSRSASASAGCGATGFTVARRARLSRGGTRARLTARVPRPGTVVVRGIGRGRKLISAVRKKARRAGRLAVFAKLNQRGRRALRRNGRVKVPLKATFRPAKGKAKAKRLKVRFAK